MKIIKPVKDFFSKPSMSFDKIVLLGLCEFFLIFIDETYGNFYGLVGAIHHALFMAIILALSVQVIRLVVEVEKEK